MKPLNQKVLPFLKRGSVSLGILAVSAGLLSGCGGQEVSSVEEAGPAVPEGTVSFAKDVAPILVTRCGPCHISDSKGDLSFASYFVLMQGTLANGAVILPGFADRSSLVTLVEDDEMPKKGGPLSASEKSTLRTWVDEGAFFDGADQGQGLTSLTGLTVPTLPEE